MQAELSREKFTPETKISEEVTLDEAVERVSRGDETVLPDIAEGVKQHGPLAMQDEIINGAITKARPKSGFTPQIFSPKIPLFWAILAIFTEILWASPRKRN